MKSKSNYPVTTDVKELHDIITEIESTDPIIIKHHKDNLSQSERRALKVLTEANDIVIKKADKGDTLIVMDIAYYRDKLVLHDHLLTDTYCLTQPNADKQVFKDLKLLMKKYEKCFTKKEYSYIVDPSWKTSNFYVLPKIHKSKILADEISNLNTEYLHTSPPSDLKGRPIVGGPNSPTQKLSELLENFLSPLVPKLKTHIKDDWDFLKKLKYNTSGEYDMISYDIVSLYTSIPHDLGEQAIRHYVNKYPELIPTRFSEEFIIEACLFILRNNNFLFDERLYHQEIGTAMGTKFAPPYACLSIGFLEETKLFPILLPFHFSTIQCKQIEDDLFRYMDDGFAFWNTQSNILILLNLLNSLHPSIKFEIEHSNPEVLFDGSCVKKINFLDITIIMHGSGNIETDIFYKPTNNHQYLDFNSHHPYHTKANIPYNLAKRIIVFVTNPVTLEKRLEDLKYWLIQCNYPMKLIKSSFFKARLQGPSRDPKQKPNILPFVTTNFSNLNNQRIVNTCNDRLQNSRCPRIAEVFKDTKVVLSQRQPFNLLQYLSKSSFSTISLPQMESGLFKCQDKRCKLCKLYIQECKSFMTAIGIEWTIKSHITCHSTNVVYYLECVPCNAKTTYTGIATVNRIRMNNHISDIYTGNNTNKFDIHVRECRKRNNYFQEPYFRIYAFVELADEKLLRTYESYFLRLKFDTMN